MNTLATRILSNDILNKIEKVSSIKWAPGGEAPTAWYPYLRKTQKYYLVILEVAGDFYLSYGGSCYTCTEISQEKFVQLCAVLMPKDV